VPKRQHVLEHRFIGLRRTRSLAPRLEAAAKHLALPFGTVKPFVQQVALPAALFELGAQAPAARQASDHIPHDSGKPAHLKAIIAPR